jgi:5,10-methylenetetrahydromethanopterin reductase
MDVSCAFATSLATPEHIALAEELGYHRAWCYDSPALYPDVWMVLALAAERTSSIGLGPAVLVPSLRHPMVNAAAIATLAAAAPGRVAVAIGAGFTGRMVLGQRPMRWSDVEAYVRVLRALLRGEDAEWEGHVLRMLHPDGFGATRPVDIPVLIGADGPKGLAVAGQLGDGVFSAMIPTQSDAAWRALLTVGTVLDEGEDPSSPRVLEAAGPALAVVYHGMYERGGAEAADALPGGQAWREAIEAVPERERHLAIHEGHLVEANVRDRPAVEAGSSLLPAFTTTGTAAEVRQRVAGLAEAGVTEIAYQPAGPDIPRELAAFAAATSGLDDGVGRG